MNDDYAASPPNDHEAEVRSMYGSVATVAAEPRLFKCRHAATVRAVLLIFLAALGSLPISAVQTLSAPMPSVPGLLCQIAIPWQRPAWQSALSRQSRSWQILAMAVLCNTTLSAAYHWWAPYKVAPPFDRLNESATPNATIVIMACFTAPLLEEVLFRGLLLTQLRRSHGVTTSVLLSAIGSESPRGNRLASSSHCGWNHARRNRRMHRPPLARRNGPLIVHPEHALEVLALRLQVPQRLGVLYLALCLTIAAIAALERRRVLLTTRWFIASNPASLVAPATTWGLDARI